MTPKSTQAPANGTESPAKWVSVADFAAACGVSPRAIQKRATRGTLAARKIERGGKEVWEVDANSSHDGREPVREHTNLLPQVDANTVSSHAQNGREPVRQVDASRFANPSEYGREQDANRAAEYRAEIAFLRATVEQLQRDGAETRAALREALKAMPKQLTMGAAEAAPEPATAPTKRADGESGGAAAKRPEVAPESSALVTIGSIADWLEAEMNL